MTNSVNSAVYEMLTGEDDGRVCRDIPDEACNAQPGNFLKHVIALAATKTGDGLSDPKLVLSWLLTSLGAPAYLTGLLVPVREAGALLPQLLIAAGVRALPRRKWVWVIGSLVQGVAILGISASALSLEGESAGWTIIGLLAVFAAARSACSVSYKDVLGKTVSKATRGTATGTAGTIAATAVLVFGTLLAFGIVEKSVSVIAAVLILAGCLWIAAAAIFATLAEVPGSTEGGGNPISVVFRQFSLLREDKQLTIFITTRGLLIATALAPPFILSMVGRSGGNQLGELGMFVLASGLAAVGSSFFWGRLSDSSSRKVLVLSAAIAALALAAGAVLGLFNSSNVAALPMAGVLFVLMVAYQGVRLGRSTHIVDMADQDKRAAYTALSNSIIGVLLVAGGAFGLLAQLVGEASVLALFAAMCIAAAIVGSGLKEVQE